MAKGGREGRWREGGMLHNFWTKGRGGVSMRWEEKEDKERKKT